MRISALRGLPPRAVARAAVRKFVHAHDEMGYYSTPVDTMKRVVADSDYRTEVRAGADVDRDDLANPYVDATAFEELRDHPESRCVLVWAGPEVIASNWYLRGDVPVPEVSATIPLPPGSHYSCRTFIRPDHRRRHLMGHMMTAYADAEPGCRVLCGVVFDWNVASIRGLTNLGWVRTSTIWSAHTVGRRRSGRRPVGPAGGHRKVRLDVGAHLGETLEVALDRRWGFDVIHSFEPAPQCWERLEDLADDRVMVHRFGLWSSDAELPLYGAGAIGASLFAAKESMRPATPARLRDAAAWFAENLSEGDEVIVKLNCEGAECEILDHLVGRGELAKVAELLVHFDVRKVPGQESREAATRAALTRAGVPFRAAESLFFGRTTQEKTRNWLAWYHAEGPARLRYSVLRRIEFAARGSVYRWRSGRVRRGATAPDRSDSVPGPGHR